MDIINIVTLIFIIIAVYPFALFIIEFIHKPKISIGLLPFARIEEEMSIKKLGKEDNFDEFKFKENFFALKVNKLKIENLRKHKKRNQILEHSHNHQYELPILIYNRGRSDLMEYNLVISFKGLTLMKR